MQFKLLLGVVFAGTLVVFSTTELCTPEQWEGRSESRQGYFEKYSAGVLENDFYTFYDIKNQRQAQFQNETIHGKTSHLFFLSLWEGEVNNGTHYILDLKTQKCFARKYKSPYPKQCLPADAKLVGGSFFGTPGKDALYFKEYRYVDQQGITYTKKVTIIDEGYIPLLARGHSRTIGDSFNEIFYHSYSLGIKDPSIFDIPKPCLKDSLDMSTPDEDMLRLFAPVF